MAPTLPAKSPRMSPHKLHHEHPVIPVTQPQQEIIIDQHEENGRGVGGIVYHPLGKGKASPMKERMRINEGMGEGVGWKGYDAKGGPVPSVQVNHQHHGRDHMQAGGGRGTRGREDGGQGDHGLSLQRQPHRDTQGTGPSPLPLPPAHTAQHHPSANHHHHAQHPQPHVNTTGGPRLFIQPPTPDNPSPPPALQVRSLNTPNPIVNNTTNTMNEGPHSKSKPKGEGQSQGGITEQGGGEGIMSRFKTTFLSKNKGPMSKTWARKSYLDGLESMAPSSPRTHFHSTFAPVSPAVGHGHGGDLESGRQGMRRIT
jgi:hypothetical protein